MALHEGLNLYIVEEVDGEWCIFVFAERANLAKVAYCNYFGNETEYIDVRARLLGNTDKVKQQVIVDDEGHPLYPIVREFGGGFTDHNGEILEAEVRNGA